MYVRNSVYTLTYSAYHVHIKYVDEIKQVVRNEPIMHNALHLQFVIETAPHDNKDEIVHDSTGDNKGPPVVGGVGRVDHKLLPEPDNQYQIISNNLENANQKITNISEFQSPMSFSKYQMLFIHTKYNCIISSSNLK